MMYLLIDNHDFHTSLWQKFHQYDFLKNIQVLGNSVPHSAHLFESTFFFEKCTFLFFDFINFERFEAILLLIINKLPE